MHSRYSLAVAVSKHAIPSKSSDPSSVVPTGTSRARDVSFASCARVRMSIVLTTMSSSLYTVVLCFFVDTNLNQVLRVVAYKRNRQGSKKIKLIDTQTIVAV
jgi:hypothetical protein